jgi:CRISPR-associated endonuclease/helicase Cas3
MAEDSTQPPEATRFIETTQGVLSYSQLAPLLAERVLKVQQDIEDNVYASRAVDESLLLDMHRGICGDLTPGWAGRFRDADVRVSEHHPPPPYRVPNLMRDYFADVNARIAALSGANDPLLLECLAFAEGRLLSIHPSRILMVAQLACSSLNCCGVLNCQQSNWLQLNRLHAQNI